MKSISIGTVLILIFFNCRLFAQVGVGTSSPDASSALDVNVIGKGFLAPRMTLANRPLTPAAGLLYYQTTNTPGFYYYDGVAWQQLGMHYILQQNINTNNKFLSGDGSNSGIHLDSNGILVASGFSNEGSNLLTSGPGTRMIWYPKRAAFRAGEVNSNEWNHDSIGYASIALGQNTIANASFTLALGRNASTNGKMGSAILADASLAVARNDTMNEMMMRYGGGYQFLTDYGFPSRTGLKLDVNGLLISNGLFGSGENIVDNWGNQSTKMIWYPKKAAFRVGRAQGNQWDNARIGNYSIAMGHNSEASGGSSVAIGRHVSTNFKKGSFIFGDSTATGISLSNDAENQMMMRFSGGYKLFTNPSSMRGIQITSNGILKYFSNVAAGFDARSMVDKNYVDSIVNVHAMTYTLQQNINTNGKWLSSDGGNNGIVMSNSNVGVGEVPNSAALFHVNTGSNYNKGFLVSGTFNNSSVLPNLGAGSRMMFYPGKAALRAGSVSGSDWDNTNVGNYSMALGRNVKASGISSIAIGQLSQATGENSVAIGFNSQATSSQSIAIGSFAIASGIISHAFGYGVNTNSHTGSFIIGDYDPSGYMYNTANNQMKMRFAGGYQLFTDPNTYETPAIEITNANDVEIGKNLTIDNNANVNGTLFVNGNTTVDAALTVESNATIDGNLTVANGKGIIRSHNGTQQKKLTDLVTVSTSFTAFQTKSFTVTWPEAFSAKPDAYIGAIDSGSGGWAEVVMSLATVTTTGAVLFVFNPRNMNWPTDFTINIIAIGPQ